MIAELRIRGLGVIDEAVIPFSPGLTVLTGETGAGKTMVLTGLALVMGQRADAGVVRAGFVRAEVDGTWLLQPDPVLTARLEEAGAHTEPEGQGELLILSRSVAAGGRSRAFVGGRPVPSPTLTGISDPLLAVHGQSDQVLLREPRRQRELLDRFGGPPLEQCRAEFRDRYEAWRRAETELRDLVDHRQERDREAALLRHGIDEIAAVAPIAGEDDLLRSQAEVLAHATDLITEASTARDLLAGDEAGTPGALDLAARARKAVDRAAAMDASLAPTVEAVAEIAGALADVISDLGSYVDRVEADPARQASVEERRSQLQALKRRYGPDLDAVLAWWRSAEETVSESDGVDVRIEEMTAAVEVLRRDLLAQANDLSALRREAATDLAGRVTAELQALAMADAVLVVDVVTTDDPKDLTTDGADTVTMLLVPHAGSAPRPLGKGASGGELSRIMLAIEVVLAGASGVPTYVFDEVDAGIGGKVAVEVGRRLARLAHSAQVIVVTHLPQVAAFADSHLVVSKGSDGAVTTTSVAEVVGEDRVAELVRMLSGLEGSASGAEHAAELLALAAGDRG